MASAGTTYELEESTDETSIKYYFVSSGNDDIVKAIEYQHIPHPQHEALYNLCFGDYDLEKDEIDDKKMSNNGDHYAVFNTVLSTIPQFFNNNPHALMVVQGSDNHPEFAEKCKAECKKKCEEICKNIARRIRTYRYYVNKNYAQLCQEYEFFGGKKGNDGKIIAENYEVGKEYDSVFCKKRILLPNED